MSAYAGDYSNDFYDVDFGGKDLRLNLDNNRAFGGAINWYLNRHVDLGVMGTYGALGTFQNGERKFKDYLTTGAVYAKYKFGLPDNALLKPYIFGGTGVTNHDGSMTRHGIEWLPVTAGAGLTLRITELFSLQYQVTYGYWSTDGRDLFAGGIYNDAHLFNTLGIGFNLGTNKDTDHDRVPDKMDKCPSTPAGTIVDKEGCPVDTDKDGIADYLDKCPALAGVEATQGCPDQDKDGVADAEDQCPTEAGSPAFRGCPDTDGDSIINRDDKCPTVPGVLALEGCPDRDGDGVKDEDDKCPDVKGVAFFNGCPDTDGDDIEDSKDACPDKKGPASTQGCPDTDNDKVHDGIDKCPEVFGLASNHGCPELKKEIKQLFQKALQGIQFETGKAVIKPVSYPILNSVVKVLQDNPTYKLTIGGYTDNVGSDELNMTLSQNRADAVANYLISKGVDPMRVSATGYGESKPVDTNKTAAGRARNRRVELGVEFMQVIGK
jgi:outer membrane protein OmpA-like peptidoglycan-associated protein